MDLIADGSLFLAAVVASMYCLVLSRRLRRLTQTDGGLGKAITDLSAEVDEMSAALETVKRSTEAAANDLDPRLEAARREIEQLKEATAAAQRVQAEMEAAAAAAPAARRTRKPRATAAKTAGKPTAKTVGKTAGKTAGKPAGETASRSAKAKTAKKAAPKTPASEAEAERPGIVRAAADAGGGEDFGRALDAAFSGGSDEDQEALATRLITALASPQAQPTGSR